MAMRFRRSVRGDRANYRRGMKTHGFNNVPALMFRGGIRL